MNIIITFSVLIAIAVLVLAITLAVQFVRLSRELRQVGDDTSLMLVALRRGTRTLQLAIPLIVAVRSKATSAYKKLRSRTKKESA